MNVYVLFWVLRNNQQRSNDCYGIAADEFANTYAVLKDKTVSQNREIPEIPDLENDTEQQFQ